MTEAEFKVALVFLSERRDGDDGTGQVDALALAEKSAIDDFTFHVSAVNGFHAELDEAVGEQYARTRLDFARQRLERSGYLFRSAEHVLRGDHQLGARLQRDGNTVLQPTGADLGAL